MEWSLHYEDSRVKEAYMYIGNSHSHHNHYSTMRQHTHPLARERGCVMGKYG